MIQTKEKEIQLVFLEEATGYLSQIETGILSLADDRLDKKQIDALIRAAHSIKGGAGMVGFEALSYLAHWMEDFFLGLKACQSPIQFELKELLLVATDLIWRVLNLNREEKEVDESWVKTHLNPIKEKLNFTLNSAPRTTPSVVTPPEDEHYTLVTLFETEVEECLYRLESVLASGALAGLFAQTVVMAQELGGLGEMLELTAFSHLCESITRHLEANPERVEEIARLALQEWRRAQAAVLVGQVDTIPEKIDFGDSAALPVERNLVKSGEPSNYNPSRRHERSYIQGSPDFTGLSPSAQDLDIPNPKELDSSTEQQESQLDTVAVSVEQLHRLNDLFIELTRQHERTALYLSQVRDFLDTQFDNLASQQRIQSPPIHYSPPTAAQIATILVIDDSLTVRKFLSLTLESANYRVSLAENGLDAFKKLLGGLQVDAIICDIDMPELDGYALLARVKSDPAFRHLPIVMLTSRDGDKDRQLAMNLGAAAYFSKPYNKQELLTTLDRLILDA